MSKWQECPQWAARARWPDSGGPMLPRQEVWIKDVQVTRVSPVSSQGRWLDSEEVLESLCGEGPAGAFLRADDPCFSSIWSRVFFCITSTDPGSGRCWSNVVFAYTFCSTARDSRIADPKKSELCGFVNPMSLYCISLVTGNKRASKKEA